MIDAIVAREIKKTKLKKNILIPEINIKTNQLKTIKSCLLYTSDAADDS